MTLEEKNFFKPSREEESFAKVLVEQTENEKRITSDLLTKITDALKTCEEKGVFSNIRLVSRFSGTDGAKYLQFIKDYMSNKKELQGLNIKNIIKLRGKNSPEARIYEDSLSPFTSFVKDNIDKVAIATMVPVGAITFIILSNIDRSGQWTPTDKGFVSFLASMSMSIIGLVLQDINQSHINKRAKEKLITYYSNQLLPNSEA